MTLDLLFLLATCATWAGGVLLLAATAKAVTWAVAPRAGRDPRHLRASMVSAASGAVLWLCGLGAPPVPGRPASGIPVLPIVWPVMTFPFWIGLACALGALVRIVQAIGAVGTAGRTAGWKSVVGWVVGLAMCWIWAQALGIRPELLRGAIPLRPEAVIATVVLFVVSVAIVQATSRAFRSRGLGKQVAVVFALVCGSVVFSVPLVWLLLTSFKDQQDNAGANLVWVPQVTLQHPFIDPDRPLVKTLWRGKEVTAAVVGRNGGRLLLDIERPYPFRGWRIEALESATRPESRTGTVVTAEFQGRKVEAFVRREEAGGGRTVEVLVPADLKGTVFETTAQVTEPVRRPGVRWQNYTEALEWLPPDTDSGLAYVKNSLWLVLASVVGTLLSCSLVGYGMSRIRFPGRKALFAVMIATMMLPSAVTMLPRFLIWRSLGAVDTLVPVWLPSFTASTFYVFLLRQFFRTLPSELEDAAKMDGCGPLRTYWRVMLPQVKPALAVIGVWTFMGVWNDFMSPLIYVSSSDKMPVSYALQLFSADKSGDFGLLTAFATMATVPVLLVFVFGQKYFVDGVQLSGLGGK
ncbi:MAG: carbohydrate ABC transporter permease [Armatimonadetes bacterium]|nr:carbohydrate ABC transporter permease [Armatimonadota bacterium]